MKGNDANFKPSGILDMINEMDNLGLENVEIRPLGKIRTKLQEKPSKEVEAKENNEVPTWEVSVKPEVPSGNEKKAPIGNGSIKPLTKKAPAKPKFVEKPEVVPDDPEFAKKTVEVKESRVPVKKLSKDTPVFKEANTKSKPEGKDFDWDNWDD